MCIRLYLSNPPFTLLFLSVDISANLWVYTHIYGDIPVDISVNIAAYVPAECRHWLSGNSVDCPRGGCKIWQLKDVWQYCRLSGQTLCLRFCTDLAHAMSGTQWPRVLDMSEDDARRALRALELSAYSSIVASFRAQGDLTPHKREILEELQTSLG